MIVKKVRRKLTRKVGADGEVVGKGLRSLSGNLRTPELGDVGV